MLWQGERIMAKNKMIKSIAESASRGVEPIAEIDMAYHDSLASKFSQPSHTGDDIVLNAPIFPLRIISMKIGGSSINNDEPFTNKQLDL